MATRSSPLPSTRGTFSDLLRRRLVTAGSTTFAMLRQLPAEYGRAVAAAKRFEELERREAFRLRRVRIGIGSIPRTIFEEFYGSPPTGAPETLERGKLS